MLSSAALIRSFLWVCLSCIHHSIWSHFISRLAYLANNDLISSVEDEDEDEDEDEEEDEIIRGGGGG